MTSRWLLVTFLLPAVFSNQCQKADSNCDGAATQTNRYSEDLNLQQTIQNALDSHTECVQNNCSCYADQITSDLAQFKSGITREMVDTVRHLGTKYQIIDNRLYRQRDCMFPARCHGIEYFIKAHIHKLPNLEMIINCRDWPQVSQRQPAGPVLSFSKTDQYIDIMYPAWSFWEGGPAIALYPTGLGRWDTHRHQLQLAATKWPWHLKSPTAFFRGSRTSAERDPLVYLSRDAPDLVDAAYTKNQAWKSPKDTLNAEPAAEVALADHCRYRFLFNYRGVAASFRFKHLFLCGSLVFHVGDEWTEFFYGAMKPWVHYVPLPADASVEQLRHMIEFFGQHDELAQRIATNGFEHVRKHLRMKDVHCYWKKLLRKYAKRLKYQVVRDEELIEVL